MASFDDHSDLYQRKEIVMAESLKATNVVLVHGGFVDGSGWEGVYKILAASV
jgi:hypothetical protein